MSNALSMDDPRRARLEMQVMERLQKLDEETLRDLNAWLSQDDPDTGRAKGLTRRHLFALLGGATVIGVSGVGGAMLLNESSEPDAAPAATAVPQQPSAPMAPAVEDLSGTVAELQSENSALSEQLNSTSGLLNLYEELDGVGLDRVVEGGLALVAAAMGRLAVGAAGLREGLNLAEQRVNQLDQSFAGLDQGLARAEEIVTSLSNMMQGLEDRLRAAGEPVAPLTDALGSFFTGLIERIPTVGPRIIETIERIEEIIGAIPESIENINNDLIRPMRERFFPREGDDVTVRLIDPLTGLIFTPADNLLLSLEDLGETWQGSLQQPVQEKLSKRADIREKIQSFKSENDLS